MHAYKGKYYLLATLHNKEKPLGGQKDTSLPPRMMRGTQIFAADRPEGPFLPISRAAQTPADWMALDGTLWVKGGTPYLVLCHEWVQTGGGTVDYIPLTADLSTPAGKPATLFRGSDGP